MKRHPLKELLFSTLLLSFGAGCDAHGETPMRAILPDMGFSIPYNAYDPHPVIGQVLRHPPEGTVPYNTLPEEYGPGPDEAARAGRELVSPAFAEDDVYKAKRLYDNFCMVCHGVAGEGDGPIIGRFPNPPSLLAPKTRGLPDGHLYHVVTYGQGLMASYSKQLDKRERWLAISYVRQLQGLGEPLKPQDVQEPQEPQEPLKDEVQQQPKLPTEPDAAQELKPQGKPGAPKRPQAPHGGQP